MGFDVDQDVIRQHATAVDEIALEVTQCAGAGASTISAQAFGLMNSFLAAPITAASIGVTSVLSAQATATSGMATGLRAMATVYDLTDEEARRRFKKLMAS